jgi:chemosensory pili system protein ChpA (sensor histidine kinase/response regulator)
MNNDFLSLDEFDISELSEEDLAVLKAFEAMNTWSPGQTQHETNDQNKTPEVSPSLSLQEDEEMLLIFAVEAEEEISSLRRIINQLEQQGPDNLALFASLKRTGHKLHGTAGAAGFSLISTIAAQIELLAEEVSVGTLSAHTGALAISGATTALEACLETITSTNQELETSPLLASLEAAYQSLHIDLQQLEQKQAAADHIDPRREKLLQSTLEVGSQSEQIAQDRAIQESSPKEGTAVAIHISSEDLLQGSSSTSAIPPLHIDARRFEHLVACTEKLVEQRAVLEDAQRQVDCALQELSLVQARLQHLAPLITQLQNGVNGASSLPERIPASSLVARVLHESFPDGRRYQRHPLSNFTPLSPLEHMSTNPSLVSNAQWDELELEHYNEQDIFIRAVKDAIADLAITTANVQATYTHLSMLQQDCLVNITHLHRDTLLLRQAAFATIVPRLERVVTMSAPGQARKIRFEVTGEEIEIDQELLDALATPLVQILRTCLVDPVMIETINMPGEMENNPQQRIWIKVLNYGKRLTFEIGFSMPIQGGAIEAICQPIQQLHGTISLQRNSLGGISFFLSIPHTRSSVFCLLVQAGDQHLLIPFNQIQRISDEQQEQTDARYSLQELLGFPSANLERQHLPLLVLSSEGETIEGGTVGIIVDEVLGEQECIVKPLSPSLQRPGIVGTTMDGKGRVLLMVDLPALIRSAPQYISSYQTHDNPLTPQDRAKILVTDDSAALRRSLTQTLQKASYSVFEAHDGVEALEKLQRYKPDICLLDIEMPNLNGYDVLQMMSKNPTLSNVKVIMLTSRGTTKHMQHALELGARAYLTKPCSQDDLFQTIESLLKK